MRAMLDNDTPGVTVRVAVALVVASDAVITEVNLVPVFPATRVKVAVLLWAGLRG